MIDTTGLSNTLADALRETGKLSVAIHSLICRIKISEKLMTGKLFYALTTDAPKSYDYGNEIEEMEDSEGRRVQFFDDLGLAKYQLGRNLSGMHYAKLEEKPIGFTQLVAALFEGEVEV